MTILVIVAGGAGTRLRSVIGDIPKALAPVGGQANLDRQINLGLEFGYRSVIVLAGDGADQIKRHLERRYTGDAEISVVVECRAQGTAGCFRKLANRAHERMLVLYGDISCDFDLGRFEAAHDRLGAIATILVQPNSHMHDSDLVELDASNTLTEIYRKPHSPGQYFENLTNAAAYFLEPDILSHVPDGHCDWFHDVFPTLLAKDIPLKAYRSWEYFQDLGTPERYQKAQQDVGRGIVGDRRSNCRTAGGLFLIVRRNESIGEENISSIAQYNEARWPVVLCGDIDNELMARLNVAGVYTDVVMRAFDGQNLDTVCRSLGLNVVRSSCVDLAALDPDLFGNWIGAPC